MSKTPEEIRKRSCSDKVRHPSEMLARMSAKRYMWKSHGQRERMWTYPCEYCAGWHLTKRMSGHGCVEA